MRLIVDSRSFVAAAICASTRALPPPSWLADVRFNVTDMRMAEPSPRTRARLIQRSVDSP